MKTAQSFVKIYFKVSLKIKDLLKKIRIVVIKNRIAPYSKTNHLSISVGKSIRLREQLDQNYAAGENPIICLLLWFTSVAKIFPKRSIFDI